MQEARKIGWRWLALIMVSVLAVDQLTKQAIERFTTLDYMHTVIPGVFNLIHTHNPGVAFSLFADAHSPEVRFLLVVFSIAVIAFLLYLLVMEHAGGRTGQIGMAMILGGAIGNVLDRVTRDGVTDFIDLHIGAYHWPTFNLADTAIVIGAALILYELLHDWAHAGDKQGA